MNTAGAVTLHNAFRYGARKPDTLFRGSLCRIIILEDRRRGATGLVYNGKEALYIAFRNIFRYAADSFVFGNEMERAQNGSVADDFSELAGAVDYFVFCQSAENVATEKAGNRLHFRGNGGVIVVKIRMASACIDDIKRIAVFFGREIKPFGFGIFRVGKVYVNKAARGTCNLVHKSAGLAEKPVLGILRYHGNFRKIVFSAVVKMIFDRSYHILKRSR